MKYLLLIIFMCLTACANINTTETNESIKNEYYVILSSLLNVNENRHVFINEHGEKQNDQLKAFKELESVYIKYIEPDLPNEEFTLERLKIIMFFSFYSNANNSAAFQEYLAADLMPIYNNNKTAFIQILQELPFLIQSNCNRLDAYFGHEGNNSEKKNSFIDQNKDLFASYLNTHDLSLCLDNFNEQPNKQQ